MHGPTMTRGSPFLLTELATEESSLKGAWRDESMMRKEGPTTVTTRNKKPTRLPAKAFGKPRILLSPPKYKIMLDRHAKRGPHLRMVARAKFPPRDAVAASAERTSREGAKRTAADATKKVTRGTKNELSTFVLEDPCAANIATGTAHGR
mmetsp:Transcript_8261/g.51436  ORF Transcript_8261/g.51436 Transcript_8261/m.51436 type:complete len:150 (-) Transcript_8261:1597-2046(-)